MKEHLIDPISKESEYLPDNRFDRDEFLILKIGPTSINENSIAFQYEFALKGEDSDTFLDLKMKKVNNVWKVYSYGLEKYKI